MHESENIVNDLESGQAILTDKDGNSGLQTIQQTPSQGGSSAGVLTKILISFPWVCRNILGVAVKTVEPDQINGKDNEYQPFGDNVKAENREFTIQNLIFGNYKFFNINFFDGSGENGDIKEEVMTKIAEWYYAVRNLALVISLAVLIYVGIRMLASSIADERAKYKKMLMGWFESFLLIFFMNYILIISIKVADSLTEIISRVLTSGTNLEYDIIDGSKGLFSKAAKLNGWNKVAPTIMYFMLVTFQLRFALMYFRRLLTVAVLVLFGPIVTVTYPIDKVGDGKAQAFGQWVKEVMLNVFIQPLHALMYVIFVGSASEIIEIAPLFAIILFFAMSKGEKIMRNLFRLTGGTLDRIEKMGRRGKK